MGKEYSPAEVFIRRKAAKEVMKLVGVLGAVLYLAEQMNPGSVNFDPRSSDFGKIKVGKTRFDISAGLGSFITLGARLVPTKHNGDWGTWAINGKGKYHKLVDLKAGEGYDVFEVSPMSVVGKTGLSYLGDFLLNKTAPVMSPFVSLQRGSMFGTDKVTAPMLAKEMVTPIPIQTFFDLEDPEAADRFWAMVLEIHGIGTSTY